METGESEGSVEDFSGVLKKEVTNPRKDTPFVVLISLLATLALARAFVLLTGAAETTTETSTYIGRNLIIGGYHIHHFFYGFALICAAAWIAIQYPTRNLPRLAAALFGGGLGLCVDEMGYFLGGQVNYFDRTTYFIATSIILVLLAALSFRSFREATRDDLRWLVGRRPRGIAILAVLQILASLALLVGGLVLLVAAGLPPSSDVQGEAGAFALGTVLVLLGILSLIVAWGLWTLQPWARQVAILFAIVSLGTDVVSIVTGGYVNAVVFGASGQTGRLLIDRAVASGYVVTAFVRDPARLNALRDSVRVVQGDALDSGSVDLAVADQEAVLVALGSATRRGSPQVLPHGIRHILDAMERHGVRRIVVLSAAGALHEPVGSIVGSLGLILARAFLPGVYREHRAMLEELRTRNLDWIAVRPVILTNGPWTGRYRVTAEGIPRGGYRVSRADVADFMIRQLTSDEFVRKMPAISN